MTDMKTKAQEVLYAYMDVEKDLSQPKILIYTLKELINQLQQSSTTHPAFISCPDIIELCEELKKL
jgi:predicted RNA-binding protein with EMAP domain